MTELPEPLRTRGRQEFFRQVRQRRRGEESATDPGEGEAVETEPELELDVERIVARVQGREGWLREAKRQLEQQRWENPEAVARSRSDRLLLAAERLEQELDAGRAG